MNFSHFWQLFVFLCYQFLLQCSMHYFQTLRSCLNIMSICMWFHDEDKIIFYRITILWTYSLWAALHAKVYWVVMSTSLSIFDGFFSNIVHIYGGIIRVLQTNSKIIILIEILCLLPNFINVKYSRLSLSRSRRDPLKYFEISVLRHIRCAELRKTPNEQPNQISQINM